MGEVLSRQEALQGRAEMLAHARAMAAQAANQYLPWGYRYEAAVLGDHCLDIAKEFDAYIKDFCHGG